MLYSKIYKSYNLQYHYLKTVIKISIKPTLEKKITYLILHIIINFSFFSWLLRQDITYNMQFSGDPLDEADSSLTEGAVEDSTNGFLDKVVWLFFDNSQEARWIIKENF